jgi:hypothetical protein
LWGIFLAFPAFIVAYLFIYTPQIIMAEGSPVQIILYSLAVAMAVFCLCSSFHGWLLGPLGILQRLALFAASAGLFWPGPVTTGAGLAIAAMVAIGSALSKRGGTAVAGRWSARAGAAGGQDPGAASGGIRGVVQGAESGKDLGADLGGNLGGNLGGDHGEASGDGLRAARKLPSEGASG